MNRKNFIACKVSSPAQWLRIYRLYRPSFPRHERKPFSMILSMWRKGKTDVWYFENNGRFAGLATTINDSELILLDYLAVAKSMRGQGIGSRILHELKQRYNGKGLLVEIESVYEPSPNHEERIQRKQFYLKNGMQPSHVVASVFGVSMELADRLLDVAFVVRVHAGGGFVEDDDGRVFQYAARDGDALLFAAGELLAAVAPIV